MMPTKMFYIHSIEEDILHEAMMQSLYSVNGGLETNEDPSEHYTPLKRIERVYQDLNGYAQINSDEDTIYQKAIAADHTAVAAAAAGIQDQGCHLPRCPEVFSNLNLLDGTFACLAEPHFTQPTWSSELPQLNHSVASLAQQQVITPPLDAAPPTLPTDKLDDALEKVVSRDGYRADQEDPFEYDLVAESEVDIQHDHGYYNGSESDLPDQSGYEEAVVICASIPNPFGGGDSIEEIASPKVIEMKRQASFDACMPRGMPAFALPIFSMPRRHTW